MWILVVQGAGTNSRAPLGKVRRHTSCWFKSCGGAAGRELRPVEVTRRHRGRSPSRASAPTQSSEKCPADTGQRRSRRRPRYDRHAVIAGLKEFDKLLRAQAGRGMCIAFVPRRLDPRGGETRGPLATRITTLTPMTAGDADLGISTVDGAVSRVRVEAFRGSACDDRCGNVRTRVTWFVWKSALSCEQGLSWVAQGRSSWRSLNASLCTPEASSGSRPSARTSADSRLASDRGHSPNGA